MNGNAARSFRLGAALLVLVTLGSVITGKAAKPARHGIPLPTDWSNRHVVYTHPRNADIAAKMQQDPRFEMQWHRRNDASLIEGAPANFDPSTPRKWHRNGNAMQRDWGTDLGVNGTVGAGNFAAKYTFDTEHADCNNDFVLFSNGLTGSGTQAEVIAFNNLYSGCAPATVPSVLFSYNMGGAVVASPVFSRDGSQAAFVQTSGGVGELVLVKWAASPASTISSPGAISGPNEPQYPACTAPCYTTVILKDNTHTSLNDTTSSPYYDYTHDIAWVGGDQGWLHKITNIFLFNTGFPAESFIGGFPAHVSTVPLYSPVFDRLSNNLFVEDANGFLYRVNATTGTIVKSGQLQAAGTVSEAPILDVTNQVVYVFSANDGSTDCAGTPCAAVYQLSTTFAANDLGTKTQVGISAASPKTMFTGGFDNAYYNSEDATGNLYVCGTTGAEATLYQVPIAAGVMPATGNSLVTLANATTNPGCSPVTDVLNPNATGGPAEKLFVGLTSDGHAPGCLNAGCIINLTTSQWQANTAYVVGQQVLNGSDHTIQVVTAITGAGNSGATLPVWNPVAGLTTADGDVTWTNQGPITLVSTLWNAGHPYVAGDVIHGSDGNLEAIQVGGFSNVTAEPTWNSTIGGTTIDGAAVWVNVGPAPFSALPAAGGTSGIIIDNVVGSGTLTGASQVYFSPLSNTTLCGATPTTGCGIQASQAGLN